MRRLMYDLLSNDPTLTALLPGGLFGDRMEFEVPLAKPFCVLVHEGPFVGIGRARQARTTLWIHDEPGDYTKIDNALKYACALIESSAPRKLNGVWLTEAKWEGTSGDLLDEARRTNVKNATFLLTGSGM